MTAISDIIKIVSSLLLRTRGKIWHIVSRKLTIRNLLQNGLNFSVWQTNNDCSRSQQSRRYNITALKNPKSPVTNKPLT